MLVISEETLRAYDNVHLVEIAKKIDEWLLTELSGWIEVSPEARAVTISDICSVAKKVGMEVETDFALFAWIVLASGPDWRAFCARQDVKRLLKEADWNPASRLLALQDLAMPEGTR